MWSWLTSKVAGPGSAADLCQQISLEVTGPVNCGKSAFIKQCSIWAHGGQAASEALFKPEYMRRRYIWGEIGRFFQEHVAYIDWDIVKGRQLKGTVVRSTDNMVAELESAADFFRSNRFYSISDLEFHSTVLRHIETLFSCPFFLDTLDHYENKGITFEPFGLYCIEQWERIAQVDYSPSLEDLVRVKFKTPCVDWFRIPGDSPSDVLIRMEETVKPSAHSSSTCLFVNSAGFNQRKNSRKNCFEECFDCLERVLEGRGWRLDVSEEELEVEIGEDPSPIFIVFSELDRLEAKLRLSKYCKDQYDIFDHLPIPTECPETAPACLPVYEEYFCQRIKNHAVLKALVFLATDVTSSPQCLLRMLSYLSTNFNQRVAFLMGFLESSVSPIRVLRDTQSFDTELLHLIFSFMEWRSMRSRPPWRGM